MIKKDCKADYVLSVKGNQPTLCEDLKDYFDIPEVIAQLETNNDMNYLRTFEKAHGQLETREYYQTDAIKWLFEKAEWHGLKTIGMVKTTIVKENKTSIEKRYFKIQQMSEHQFTKELNLRRFENRETAF